MAVIIAVNAIYIGVETDHLTSSETQDGIWFYLEHLMNNQDNGAQAMDLVSVMRILRVARVARIIRLLRLFKTLWLLIIGVLDAMRTLVWAWVLITVIIFVFAVFMTRVL